MRTARPLALILALTALAGTASADDVAVNPDGDASAGVLAVGTGNASCNWEGIHEVCTAVSLGGDAYGGFAVAPLGTATAYSSFFPVNGWAVSVTGWAAGQRGGVSVLGPATGLVAVSPLNNCWAPCVAAAPSGDVHAHWLAASGDGDAQAFWVAVAPEGGAAAWGAGVSRSGQACGINLGLSVHGRGCALILAVSGTGPADGDFLGASGTGDAQGFLLAASGTGDARGVFLAVSGTGDAEGLVAVRGCEVPEAAGQGGLCPG